MKKLLFLMILILIFNTGFSLVDYIKANCDCDHHENGFDADTCTVGNGVSCHSTSHYYDNGDCSCSLKSTYSNTCQFTGWAKCECNTGLKNCDDVSGNGCETSINYNDSACGSCTTPCTSPSHCINYHCINPEDMARVAVEVRLFWEPDILRGFNNVAKTNCESYPSYCTSSLHGFNGDENTEQTGLDFTGYIKCSDDYYKNCNYAAENNLRINVGSGYNMDTYFLILNGCESDIRHDNNNCGSCGTVCNTNTQWCWQGECISKVGQDFTHGTCSGSTQVCPDQSTVETGATYGNTCAYSPVQGSPKCTCNYGYKNCDGTAGSSCETPILTDPNNCGSCSNVCQNYLDTHLSSGASGNGQCSAYKFNPSGGKSQCQYTCSAGGCSAVSYSPGQCTINSDCLSNICVDSNTITNIDNGRKWCCQGSTQCGYNGGCYDSNAALPTTINGRYYYCFNSQWYEISPILNLSRMVDYDHGLSISSNAYFSNTGVSSVCDNSKFIACEKTTAYSFKYCFNYNIVFDGIFNIEAENRVPVLVSEQELYNPYFKPQPIVSTLSSCNGVSGTIMEGSEGVMYCAR
ncbi:MAG: hypothetical protein WC376_04500 [Candidatus Nanoarchaeia archaeon]|jgi:hypothetical protein